MNPKTVCRHLRTKKMFVPDLAEKVFAQENGQFTDGSHCWCNRTLAEVGCDDKPVGIRICDTTRSCFEE